MPIGPKEADLLLVKHLEMRTRTIDALVLGAQQDEQHDEDARDGSCWDERRHERRGRVARLGGFVVGRLIMSVRGPLISFLRHNKTLSIWSRGGERDIAESVLNVP